MNGLLYGTTTGGGKDDNGAVFEVAKGGTERVVYSFKNKPDGAAPAGGLAVINGVLYGTTSAGGDNKECTYGCGTVFAVHPDGKERVLYSFGGKADGADPHATLTVWDGSLYGTTVRGGADGRGTIFEIENNGTERVLRSLDEADGYYPYAGLTVVNGALYGTALRGGGRDDGGAVFGIQPDGAFHKVYAFTGKSGDGKAPNASLVVANGNLVGTTRRGGIAHGTVFQVAP